MMEVEVIDDVMLLNCATLLLMVWVTETKDARLRNLPNDRLRVWVIETEEKRFTNT